MIEILWQYDPKAVHERPMPATAREAQQLLTDGNRAFAELLAQAQDGATAARRVIHVAAEDLGLPGEGSQAPEQLPFAAVLGCADARVPVELIFSQHANDLFVVRVAGNSPSAQSMGSLEYAVSHLPSVRLLVALGHTGCGASGAAADAFLKPASYMGITADLPLRSIIDSIMTASCGAADVLKYIYGEEVHNLPGYRTALIEIAVVMNAALTAAAMRQIFRDRLGPQLDVVYGVYNLQNRLVGLPAGGDDGDVWQPGLCAAPQGSDELSALAVSIAKSRYVAAKLKSPGQPALVGGHSQK